MGIIKLENTVAQMKNIADEHSSRKERQEKKKT